MMSEYIARNLYSSQGTINYSTQLHLVGHFRKLYHDARNHECQDRQWKYNVILKGVRATIVAVKRVLSITYYEFMFAASVNQHANAHVPYFHPWSAPLCNIFPHYLIKRHDFRRKFY